MIAAVQVQLENARTLMMVNVALLLLTVGFFAFVAFVLIRRSILQRMESERLAAMGTASARILHQVKNPMQTLMIQADALSALDDPQEKNRLAQGIVSEARRLSDLLGELSTFAAGGRRQLTPVNTSIAALLRDLGEAERLDGERAGVTVVMKLDGEAQVNIDVYFLRQALQNFMRNAREALQQAERADGVVRLSLDVRAAEVVIEVADNGPGLSPDKADRIFEPFATTKPKGMGLGLPIARDIIEAHGGQVEVRSKPTGCTVRVTIPRVRDNP